MSAPRKTSAPKGRNVKAQGQEPNPAAVGHESHSTSSPAGAKEMPSGWHRVQLGEIGRWFGGGTPSKSNSNFWTDGDIPWVSPKDMKTSRIADAQDRITSDAVANSATSLVEKGSVLVVVRSGILKHTLPVAITEREVALNQDLKAVTPNAGMRSDYLALALKAFERDILRTCCKSGTTVQNLAMPVFLRFQIPVAPEKEQLRIVAEIEKQFTRLDAGVASLRRVQTNLKRYRAAVLKAACEGKLVPTEAELAKKEGRSFESGETLLQRILTERRNKWTGRGKYKEPSAPDTTNLPKLPEGWAWVSPECLCQFEDNAICAGPFGTIFKAKDFRPRGIPIIFLRHVAPGHYLTHKPGFMDKEIWNELFQPYSVFGGELLITKLGEPPGVCAIYPFGLGPAMVTPDVIKLAVNPKAVFPLYLMHYFNSENARKFATGVAFGTTRLRLTIPIFRNMPIPLPPLAEQTRIVAEVERRLSVVEELETVVSANLQRATRLRQSIMQKAFSGELIS